MTTAIAPQRAPRRAPSAARPGGAAAARAAAAAVAGRRLAEARVALGDLHAHVGDVQARDLAGAVEHRRRVLGLVGVDVDLQRLRVADHEHRVAERLERLDEAAAAQPAAGDGEVRAEAVGARAVLGGG